MDSTKATTHIGLCAGYGGIELGLHRVIPNLRSVALCEIEGFAIANLVAKMEAGLMDPAPIWPNLKTFPWRAFRDRVDILTGGYPCQPFSAAGKRAGKDDPRHLWPWIADGIRLLRPRLCFFENVEGHISLGLRDVIEDLGRLGYGTTWGIFSAAEVGAPHQRKRVFILAHRNDEGFQGRLSARIHDQGGWKGPFHGITGSGGHHRPELADTSDSGRREDRKPTQLRTGVPVEPSIHCWTPGSGQAQEIWPSRPGQPQYGWEPPRVVGSDGTDFLRRIGWVADANRLDQSASAEGRQHDPEAGHAGEAVADAQRGRGERRGNAGELGGEEGEKHSKTPQREWHGDTADDCGTAAETVCDGQAVGDPSCEQDRGIQQPGVQADAASASSELGDTEGRDGLGSTQRKAGHAAQPDEGDNERQTEPTLGGDTDGTSGGLDYAELCVSCDNRTDELRLLGNGVVPATAERAFRVLMQELMHP